MSTLGSTLYVDPHMAALWSGASFVEHVLTFEAALARAQSRAGVVPLDAAEAIADAAQVSHFDLDALLRESAQAGSPAIPIVRALTERVAEVGRDYVHWGATSQDAIDTALVLAMRESLELMRSALIHIGERCVLLADQNRRTVMAGRTMLQQAGPITFGLKAARWLTLVTRRLGRLALARQDICVVQLGGATGTLASLGERGPEVTELLASELRLAAPPLPWHAERDRVAVIGAEMGITAGAMAKIAGDLVLLSQTEIGEVREARATERGGSSAMPHKRNPSDAVAARAAARLALAVTPVLLGAMDQELERAAGAWQAEWAALADLFGYTSGAVMWVAAALDGLEPQPERMRENMERDGGLLQSEALTTALAARIGKREAFRIVREIANRNQATGGFGAAARSDERVLGILSPEEMTRTLDPSAFLGSSGVFIDRAIAGFRGSVQL